LMKFVEAMDVFVCDYIATIKICQTDMYKMYIDSTTSFQPKFFSWIQRCCKHILYKDYLGLGD